MSSFSDLRRNPFTGAISWRTMTPEIHTIAELDNLPGLYGFQLQDKPRPGTVTATENIVGGQDFDIVNSNPLPGQLRIDFDQGFLILNLFDSGKEIVVNYEGGGTNANVKNLGSLIPQIGVQFVDNELHGQSIGDVFTDTAFTFNNQAIDLLQPINLIQESVKIYLNTSRLLGEVGINPESMQNDFMVKTGTARVWFNDAHSVTNSDLIIADYRIIN